MPEIAEAQALLAALAEKDQVKFAAVSRERRLQLQTDYGRPVMWSKGFGSNEAKAALARAQELFVGNANVDARFEAYGGLRLGGIQRGELSLAQEIANTLRREANHLARLHQLAGVGEAKALELQGGESKGRHYGR